jgi:DNA-binding beta-propeller fold protein YncE
MRVYRGFGVALLALATVAPAGTFVNFESGHVRPLAFVASADLLLAVDTPGARLSIFRATGDGLEATAEVPVGLEPVAVAARTLAGGIVEAWVVNHLSDSVSVVRIDPANPAGAHVTRTVLVGDEPRDVVFAGTGGTKAFVTTAHRGQHRPGDPQAFVPGVGRADVWVFDASSTGNPVGGTPVTIVTLLADTPRALAVSPDGGVVYAAAFHSGNGTATVNEMFVTQTMGLPPPPVGATPGGPPTGLIVKHDPATGQWNDEILRDWSAGIPFDLPDYDVFAIDADAAIPVQIAATPRVGTVLFGMAVRPTNGNLFVGNLEARNEVRFEPMVRGNLAQSRITVVTPSAVTPVHLNAHVDYETVPGPPAEVAESLAFPVALAFTADGTTLFAAAMGSGKLGIFDADLLESGTALPRQQLEVGGGPTGIAVDTARDRLYVMNRFDHVIATVIDASLPIRALGATVPVGWDPTPASINAGRRFLYDARTTSAHGDAACASCHVFGDTDDLAWDLGDPFAAPFTIPGQPKRSDQNGLTSVGPVTYHPMKGPFLTQSLRGLPGSGPLHWRGDRSAASGGGDPFDAGANFRTFNVAFPGLLGGAALDPIEMQKFTDFVLSLRYPPNPYRALDDVLTPEQAAGATVFSSGNVDPPATARGNGCATCHVMPLGTDGRLGFPINTEIKIPHLRSAYQKVGRFGAAAPNDHLTPAYEAGNEVRGFGLEFNGAVGSLFDFHASFAISALDRQRVSAFVLVFDTGLKPAVGEQLTITSASAGNAAVLARLALLVARDDANDCELVAHAVVGGTARAWRYVGAGRFQSARFTDPLPTTAALVAVGGVPGQEITFTCVPPDNGRRFGNDVDDDHVLDGDELAAGSDPHDPASVPVTTTPISTRTLTLKDRIALPDPSKRRFKFKATTKLDPPANRIVTPAAAGAGDPRTHGATLLVYNMSQTFEVVAVTLPASGWIAKGDPSAPTGYRFKGTDPAGPVKTITIANDKLSISGGKGNWPYSLDEPQQGAIAMRLTLGTGVEWCSAAVAGKIDLPDKFVGLRMPPPAECPTF